MHDDGYESSHFPVEGYDWVLWNEGKNAYLLPVFEVSGVLIDGIE